MYGDTSSKVVNDETLDEFEKERQIIFPTFYRKFIKLTNGGTPDQKKYPIENMLDNPFGSIQCFFGFSKILEVDLLQYNYDLYVGAFPHGIVPIAATGGGDYVCFDLRDGSNRVVFWDKRHFWGTGEWRESDLYLIADSFAKFVNVLT